MCVKITRLQIANVRPMKLDLQSEFLAQNSGKMMRAVIIHYLLQLKTVKIA